jgi:tRNA 2-selenouridine synthase SelU
MFRTRECVFSSGCPIEKAKEIRSRRLGERFRLFVSKPGDKLRCVGNEGGLTDLSAMRHWGEEG